MNKNENIIFHCPLDGGGRLGSVKLWEWLPGARERVGGYGVVFVLWCVRRELMGALVQAFECVADVFDAGCQSFLGWAKRRPVSGFCFFFWEAGRPLDAARGSSVPPRGASV